MRILELLQWKRRRLFKNLTLGASVSLLVFLGSILGYFEGFEALALDLLFRLRGQIKSPQIILVQIDDSAFHNLGERQPLSRAYLAGLIDVLAKSGARVIGLDVELIVPTEPKEDNLLLQAIDRAAYGSASRVVTIYTVKPGKTADGQQAYLPSSPFTPKSQTVAGFANAPVDRDGLIRRVPLVVRAEDGGLLPSFALAVLARHAGYDPYRLKEALNRRSEISLLLPRWNRFEATLDPQPTLLTFHPAEDWKINFTGAQGSFKGLSSDPIFHLAKQKERLASDNPFREKIVLVGATFPESRDFFPTPHGPMSGIEIHANIIHTILSRTPIRPAHRVVALSLSLALACLMALLFSLFRPLTVTLSSLAAIPFLLIPLSYVAFARLGLWVDFVSPLLAIQIGGAVGDRLERRHIRRALGQFLSREVADQIVKEDERLDGQTKVATIFFSDLRNFTTLCEGIAPEEVVRLLNQVFGMMTQAIRRHNGVINKFVGDAVMAIYGVPRENPSHALDAVNTALEVQGGLVRLNEGWKKEGLPTLQMGIGIHTGEVLAGIVGSEWRKEFTVTGDAVNVASRVEGLNKNLSTSILITRQTWDLVRDGFRVRDCGEISMKGRQRAVQVFEVLESDAASPERG